MNSGSMSPGATGDTTGQDGGTALLEFREVNTHYGAVHILKDVNLSIYPGELVCLLGGNASGKTTTLKTLLGMVPPTSGEVVLDGEVVNGQPTSYRVANGVTMVPENRRLFKRLSVKENLLLGAFRREARKRIKESLALCFDTFPALAARRRQLAGRMSGGEQQMLALARALMSCPRLLIVDEPSVGLSPQMVSRTITKIKELKESQGLTVLMAEQNFNQAVKIADRGYVIVHGRIEHEAASAEALRESELIKRFYLGA